MVKATFSGIKFQVRKLSGQKLASWGLWQVSQQTLIESLSVFLSLLSSYGMYAPQELSSEKFYPEADVNRCRGPQSNIRQNSLSHMEEWGMELSNLVKIITRRPTVSTNLGPWGHTETVTPTKNYSGLDLGTLSTCSRWAQGSSCEFPNKWTWGYL